MFRYEYIYVDVETGEILNLNKNEIKRNYDEQSRETIKKWGIPDTKITIIVGVKNSTQQECDPIVTGKQIGRAHV